MGPVRTLPPTSRVSRWKRPEIPFREETRLETVQEGERLKSNHGETIASFYRSITTLPVTTPLANQDKTEIDNEEPLLLEAPPPPILCPVCNLPLSSSLKGRREHNSSTAHLSRIVDPHPPSLKPLNLDRSSVGYKVLTSQGWSENDRHGLGAENNKGRREPVKASRVKNDTVGLGIKEGNVKEVAEETKRLMSGKEIRRQYERERKRHQALMEYMNH